MYTCPEGKVNKDNPNRIICDSSWIFKNIPNRRWGGSQQIRGYEGYSMGWDYSLDSLYDRCTDETCCI